MTLTEHQTKFILENFFRNDYAGWENIARKLLTTGKCVVAGNRCIWIRGIGNYITTTEADGYFGCLVYKFDLYYFLTSAWFNEIYDNYVERLGRKKIALDTEYNDIHSLKSTIRK